MKVLITGSQGFVGKAIVECLKQNDIEIIQLQNNRRQQTDCSHGNESNIFKIDITKKIKNEELEKLKKIGNIDAVVHGAGLAHQFNDTADSEFWAVNVQGTENILELSRQLGVKHFILISSVSVYGNVKNKSGKEERTEERKEGIDENSECEPKDAYAESKLESEIRARGLCEQARIDLTILRLATVIGEGDPGNFLRLIRTIDKRRFFWIGKGTNYKSLIHREDIAEAVFLLLKKKKAGIGVYNVSAEPLQMKEVVETVSAGLKKSVPGVYISKKLLKPIFNLNKLFLKIRKIEKVERTIEKWLAEDVYSNRRLKREYAFEPKIGVKQAIAREVNWYIKNRTKK